MKINKLLIMRVVFVVWIVLCINFIARELFKKGYIKDYITLLSRDEDGRRSYVYGDDFYGLLKYFKDNAKPGTTFRISGIKELSVDDRRAVYFLYPFLKSSEPDYILVFNEDVKDDRYEMSSKLDDKRYILKKKGV